MWNIGKTNVLILLSILLAFVAGNILCETSLLYTGVIDPVGKIFVILLKFVVAPCVFFNIISGILSFDDFKQMKRIGLLTFGFFFVTTLIAILIAFGVNFAASDYYISDGIMRTVSDVSDKSFRDVIFGLIPRNIVEPFVKGSMMQIIIVSLLLGISAAGVTNQRAKDLLRIQAEGLSEVFNRLVRWIVQFAPVGVFCLLTPVFFKTNADLIKPLMAMIVVIYVCFALHFIFVYFGTLRIILKRSIKEFMTVAFPAQVMAFCSNSSLSTLPLNLECAEKLKVSRGVKNFVIPIGNTINMDGAAIIQSSILIFLMTYLGIDITATALLMIVVCVFLISVGAAGIPGGGIVLLCMVFPFFGIPSEYVEIMLGISYLYETTATMLNVTGDLIGALFVDKFAERKANLR